MQRDFGEGIGTKEKEGTLLATSHSHRTTGSAEGHPHVSSGRQTSRLEGDTTSYETYGPVGVFGRCGIQRPWWFLHTYGTSCCYDRKGPEAAVFRRQRPPSCMDHAIVRPLPRRPLVVGEVGWVWPGTHGSGSPLTSLSLPGVLLRTPPRVPLFGFYPKVLDSRLPLTRTRGTSRTHSLLLVP